ncbi:hypothetical protein KIN20_029680 [Parelaphostrongylus tenuis]|uniref:Uncharacterized protein n=1 Tax=Parelaphostrongylus tenuis TaxID=148309 RepID=A0AAD5R2T2_PARTN|nr:hypothetical protein KIN20_029680 [Parelaphostrongylus tenuis]
MMPFPQEKMIMTVLEYHQKCDKRSETYLISCLLTMPEYAFSVPQCLMKSSTLHNVHISHVSSVAMLAATTFQRKRSGSTNQEETSQAKAQARIIFHD